MTTDVFGNIGRKSIRLLIVTTILFGTAELKPIKSNPFKIASGFSFLCVSIVYQPLFDYWNLGKQVKK